MHFIGWRRSGVVDAVSDVECGFAIGREDGSAIVAAIRHHELTAVGGAPTETRRHFGHRRTRIYAYMQKTHAGCRKHRHQPDGVAGHVGQLGSDGATVEPTVEVSRDNQAGLEQRGIEKLGVGVERKGVPGDVASGDGFL